MVELTEVIIVVGTSIVSYVTGRVHKRVPRPPKPRPPICSCAHGYGQHESGGRCQAQIKRACGWNKSGEARIWEYVDCPCTNYDGPMTVGM